MTEPARAGLPDAAVEAALAGYERDEVAFQPVRLDGQIYSGNSEDYYRKRARVVLAAALPRPLEVTMPDLNVDLDLAAIRARADAATPGPWQVERGHSFVAVRARYVRFGPSSDSTIIVRDEDAEFIAQARQDVPALLQYIGELQYVTQQLAEQNLTHQLAEQNQQLQDQRQAASSWDDRHDELAATVASLEAQVGQLRGAAAGGAAPLHPGIEALARTETDEARP